MFSDLTNRLINLHKIPEARRAPSVIFGSAASLSASLEQKTPIRIALMPALSADQPDLALGLMSLLGYLLENFQDITVYRQFARLEGDPADFEWNIEASQFLFEEWHLEPLDDNTTVWAALQYDHGTLRFTVEAESDYPDETVEPFRREYAASGLADMIDQLPQAAHDLTDYLTADLNRVHLVRLYDPNPARDADQVLRLIEKAALFEVHVLLHLWGKEQPLFDEWSAIYQMAVNIDDGGFSAWLMSAALKRLLLPGITQQLHLPDDEDLYTQVKSSPLATANFARGISQRGDHQSAIQYILTALDDLGVTPETANLVFVLGDLYLMTGHIQDGVTAYEDAAEVAPDSATIHLRIAQSLSLLDDLSKNSGGERSHTQDIVEAYEYALGLDSKNQAKLLAAQVITLAKDMTSDDAGDLLVGKFEALVTADHQGEYVSDLLEELYGIDEVEFDALQAILETAVTQVPDRTDRKINLATAYILNEEHDRALELLEEALQKTSNPDQLAEVQRLILYADDPDFEAIIGEIIDKISSRTSLDETEIDYLEQVVEVAPRHAEAYVLLAQGYQLWNDADAVMDTLLDAVKQLPNEAELLVMLAKVLLDSDQDELALQYLQHSVEQNPTHIPTLALLGRVLFDMDRDNEARAYIAQAQTLGPKNAAVTEVRAYIARKMSER